MTTPGIFGGGGYTDNGLAPARAALPTVAGGAGDGPAPPATAPEFQIPPSDRQRAAHLQAAHAQRRERLRLQQSELASATGGGAAAGGAPSTRRNPHIRPGRPARAAPAPAVPAPTEVVARFIQPDGDGALPIEYAVLNEHALKTPELYDDVVGTIKTAEVARVMLPLRSVDNQAVADTWPPLPSAPAPTQDLYARIRRRQADKSYTTGIVMAYDTEAGEWSFEEW